MRRAAVTLLLLGLAHAQDPAALGRAIADPDPDVRLAAAQNLGRLGSKAAPAVDALVDAAYDETYEVRLAALRALRTVGPAAAAAVPALEQLRGDYGLVDRLVRRALVAIGPGPRPALLDFLGIDDAASLRDVDPELRDQVVVALSRGGALRAQAAHVLRRIAPGDATLLPALARALEDPRAYARWEVYRTLAAVGPKALPVFLKELKQEDVRRRRLGALGVRGQARAAVGKLPQVVAALDDEDRVVRRYAVLALGEMRALGAPAVPRLLELLDDPELRMSVLHAFLLMGKGAEAAAPAIARLLDHEDPAVRAKACDAFFSFGAAAAPAVPALARTCYDTDTALARSALRVLGRIGRAAAPAAPYLAELGEADSSLTPFTSSTLQAIGAGAPLPPPPRPEDETALVEQMANPEKEAAGRAAFQLGRLRPQGGPALRALRRALGSPRRYVRRHAALALVRCGQASIPVFIDALANGGVAERRLASDSLGKVGFVPGLQLEPMLRALDDPDPFVRSRVASALGMAGRAAARAVPALVRLARSADESVANCAIWSLGRMGPDASPAVPVLTARLSEWESQGRAWAIIAALGEIGEAARVAIPAMVSIAVEDNALESVLMPTLVKFGPPGEAALVEIIREGHGNARAFAIETVMQRGLEPPGLRAALEAGLADPNNRARLAALNALPHVPAEGPLNVAALMEGLRTAPLERYNQSHIPALVAKQAAPEAVAPFVMDDDERVRWCAWNALALMDAGRIPDALRAKLEPRALAAAAREKSWVQWAASGYLAKVPPSRFSGDLLRCLADSALKSIHPRLLEVAAALPEKGRAGVVAAAAHDDLAVRRGAAIVIRLYGPEGAAALPALRRGLTEDSKFRYVYFRAIVAIGEPALPVMLELLPMASTSDRKAITHAITKLGPAALPALRRELQADDWERRRTATYVLSGLGADAIPDLLRLLDDPSSAVRRAALYQLGGMDEHADAVVPAVLAGLRSKDRNTVTTALAALRKLGGRAQPGLEKAAAAEDPGLRRAAMKGAPVIGDAALPLLARGLEDKDAAVRAQAAGSLAGFKEKAAPLVPALRKALKDPESRVRHEAAWTISQTGEAAVPAIPDLVLLFDGGTSDDRRALEKALVKLGEPAAPPVVKLLERDDDRLAQATVRLLGRMGKHAVPALVAAFEADDPRLRERAGEALRSMRQPAVAALIGLLAHESPDVRRNAAWRLGQLERVALGAVAALTDRLADEDRTVVGQAAWALGQIGPAAREALPALQKLYDAGRQRAIVRDAMRKIRG